MQYSYSSPLYIYLNNVCTMKKIVAKKPPRFHKGSPTEQWNEYCITEGHGKDQSLIEFGGAKVARKKALKSEIEEFVFIDLFFDKNGERSVASEIILSTTKYGLIVAGVGEEVVNFNNLHGWMKLPSDKWMSKSLDCMPYGIIDKQLTGLGATTLEINSERDSIIVVPTRALAKTKTTKHRQTFRLDGSVKDYHAKIKDYVESKAIRFKKFIVVADSLHKLPEVIGDKIYDDYFILIDEIDMVQADSTYRSAMEDIIDYYFLFDPKKRALISATVKEFSNPLLQKEPFIKIAFNKLPKPKITEFIEIDDTESKLIEKIKNIRAKYPRQKIVIAYNSPKSILRIIEHLPIELDKECAVLCGEGSKELVEDYYRDLDKECKLPNEINFITSAYFVGVDFEEQFHLIIVANARNKLTLVSIDQIIQISGRCRSVLYSSTIIHNILNESEAFENVEGYKYMIQKDANSFLELTEGVDEMKAERAIWSKYIPSKYRKQFLDTLATFKTTIITEGEWALNWSVVDLIRTNIFGESQKAYFNIDSLINNYTDNATLYKKYGAFHDKLKEKYEIENYSPYEFIENHTEPADEEDEVIEDTQQTKEKARDKKKKIKDAKISQLKENILYLYENEILTDKELAKIILKNRTSTVIKFVKYFKKLYHYIEPTILLEELSNRASNSTGLKNYTNALTFWLLDDGLFFKKTTFTYFKKGGNYTPEQIHEILNFTFGTYNIKLVNSSRTAVEYFNCFFSAERTIKREPEKTFYTINSHYSSDITPIIIESTKSKIPISNEDENFLRKWLTFSHE